jgi:hypothetical protein
MAISRPPPREQPFLQLWCDAEFLDGLLDGGLFVGRLDIAEQFRGRALDVVDRPNDDAWLRSLVLAPVFSVVGS